MSLKNLTQPITRKIISGTISLGLVLLSTAYFLRQLHFYLQTIIYGPQIEFAFYTALLFVGVYSLYSTFGADEVESETVEIESVLSTTLQNLALNVTQGIIVGFFKQNNMSNPQKPSPLSHLDH